MQNDKGDLTGDRNNNRIPNFVEERDPTQLGGNVVSLGKMIVYYHIGLERQLNEDKTFWRHLLTRHAGDDAYENTVG